MTDYLALRTEENEDALLKLERRLAAALAGAAGRTQGAAEGPATERGWPAARAEAGGGAPSSVQGQEEGAGAGGGSPLSPDGGGGRGRARESKASPLLLPAAGTEALTEGGGLSPWRDALEAAEGRWALLEQLERLERAAYLPEEAETGRSFVPAGSARARGPGNRLDGPLFPLSPPDRGAELPGLTGVAGGGALRSGPEGRAWTSGGASDWAELVDLAFRRDSRRYDGGFYLY